LSSGDKKKKYGAASKLALEAAEEQFRAEGNKLGEGTYRL